jgi:hypothetical protein
MCPTRMFPCACRLMPRITRTAALNPFPSSFIRDMTLIDFEHWCRRCAASSRQTSSFRSSPRTSSAWRSSSTPPRGMPLLCTDMQIPSTHTQSLDSPYPVHLLHSPLCVPVLLSPLQLISLIFSVDRRDSAGNIVGVIGVGQVDCMHTRPCFLQFQSSTPQHRIDAELDSSWPDDSFIYNCLRYPLSSQK